MYSRRLRLIYGKLELKLLTCVYLIDTLLLPEEGECQTSQHPLLWALLSSKLREAWTDLLLLHAIKLINSIDSNPWKKIFIDSPLPVFTRPRLIHSSSHSSLMVSILTQRISILPCYIRPHSCSHAENTFTNLGLLGSKLVHRPASPAETRDRNKISYSWI